MFCMKILDLQNKDIYELMSLKNKNKYFYSNSIIDICSTKN